MVPAAYYDSSLPLPVMPVAFQPDRERDVDGLSFFREDFVSPIRLAAANENARGCCVTRLRVKDLHDLGLSVLPTPHPDEQAGHVIVPEMSYGTYKNSKKQVKDIQDKLARKASAAIAHFKSPLKP